MTATASIEPNPARPTTPGAFFEAFTAFLLELRSAHGFRIDTERVLAAHTLLLTLAERGMLPADWDGLGVYLGPLLCASADEQARFDGLYRSWLDRLAGRAPAPAERGVGAILDDVRRDAASFLQRWRIALAVVAVLAVIIGVGEILRVGRGWLPKLEPASSGEASAGKSVREGAVSRPLGVRGLGRRSPATLLGVAAAVIALGSIWWWWWRRQAGLVLERRPELREPLVNRLSVSRPSLALFPDLARGPVGRSFARRRPIPGAGIDPGATVAESVRSGGLLTPVATSRLVAPEYLALVDRRTPNDHQAAYAETMLDRLEDAGAILDRYEYAGDLRVLTSRGEKAALRLSDLRDRHPDHRLLVFGTGEGLMDPATGLVADWAEPLTAWPERVLVTPETPAARGDRHVWIARSGLMVVPATPAGLGRFIGRMHGEAGRSPSPMERTPAFPPELRDHPDRWLSEEAPEPSEVVVVLGDLRRLLGDEGYAWLAACAVYPELNWDLTLFLGQSVTDGAGAPLLTPARLTALVRLPWFRRGAMPDWLRERLIDDLGPGREAIVRSRLDLLLLGAAGPDDVRFQLSVAIGRRGVVDEVARAVFRRLSRDETPEGPCRDAVYAGFMNPGFGTRRLAVRLRRNVDRILRPRAPSLPPLPPPRPSPELEAQARLFRLRWATRGIGLYAATTLVLYGYMAYEGGAGASVVLGVQLAVQFALAWFPAGRAAGRRVSRPFGFLAWAASGFLSSLLALAMLLAYGGFNSSDRFFYPNANYLYGKFILLLFVALSAVLLSGHTGRDLSVTLSDCASRVMKSAALTALATLTSLFLMAPGGGGHGFSSDLLSILGIIVCGVVFYLELGPWLVVAMVRHARDRAGVEAGPRPPAGWSRYGFPGLVLILSSMLAAAVVMDLRLPPNESSSIQTLISIIRE